MSYQFSLDQSNRSLRFPVLVMAGIFSAVIGAYTFAACNERTPNQAAAGEARGSKPGGGPPGGRGPPARGVTRARTLQSPRPPRRDYLPHGLTGLFNTHTQS